MASTGRERWEKFKKERDSAVAVASSGNKARDGWQRFKANRTFTMPKEIATSESQVRERSRSIYTPSVPGATAAQRAVDHVGARHAADAYIDTVDPEGAEDRREAREYQRLVSVDLEATDREIADMEAARAGYDDAFLTWATGYEMNPGAWDPEEYSDNIARYEHLKKTYGSVSDLDRKIADKKKTRRKAEQAKSMYAAARREAGYEKKYAGMTYAQLQQAMAGLDEASEEYKWLSRYAPTVMTAQDHRDAFSQAQSDRAALDAEREIYDDAFFTWATGYEMNPGAWDPDEYAENIAKYEQLKKTHGSIGAAAAYYEQKEQQLDDKWWMLDRNARYAGLEENKDYAEQSAVRADGRTATFGIGLRDAWLGMGDPKYDYINDLGGVRASSKSMDDGTYQQYDYMTAQEISNYNYIYNTQGKDAAEEYLEYLEYTLNRRMAEKMAAAYQKSAEDHPFLASVASVPLNLAAGGGFLDVAGQHVRNYLSGENKPIDYNRPAMHASIGTTTIRQTVAQDLATEYGVIEMDAQRNPVMARIFNGKSLGDVYQAGMSMVDSAAVAAMYPFIGDAGVVLLGGSAATQGMLNAVASGATDEQAMVMGLINGAAEIVFENISLKSLLNGPTDSLIKTIINQGFEEGREEFLTSLVNNFADILIMAEKSGYLKNVEQYKAQGYSESEAVCMALTDMGIEMGWDFVGGALTGGIMGGGAYAVNTAGQKLADKAYQNAAKASAESGASQQAGAGAASSNVAGGGDGLVYAGQSAETAETENTAQTDGVRYSIRNTSQMPLKEQLSKFYGNKLKSSDAFYLGETPAVLEKAGAKAAPLVMTTSSFKKSVTDKHNIPRRVINKLSENLQKPILSFGVNGESGVLIGDIDGDGKPVLVAIHADQIMDNEKVNNVKSIYGLDNPEAWIQNQIDSGKRLEVYDEAKANAFLRSYGYQALQEDGVRSVTRIADPRGNVNQNHSTSGGKILLQGNQGHTFEVELGSVASAGDGKLVINLQGGGSADVSNMSFPNAGMQLLYQTVAKIADSTETAQQLLDGIKFVEGSAQNYALGIEQVYLYGKLQMPLEEAVRSSNAVKQLSPELRSSVYEMGQRAGQKQTEQARQKASDRSSGRQREGGVFYGYNGQAIDKKKLSPAQRVAVDFAQRLAERKGMTFYFYRSQVNEKGVRVYRDRSGKIVEADNGFYDPSDGSIHIDLNCDSFGDTILFTLAHELTHFIQDTNPEGYRRLCEILTRGYMDMNQSMDQLVKNKQEEYRNKGKNLSYEEAYDEVIAASMESILADGKVLDLLDELETKDKSLREQIRSFIEDTARLLKEIIDAYRGKRPTSPEGRIVMRMNTLYEQLQEAFAQSLHEGGENYRQGGQTNTAPEGGVKNQARASATDPKYLDSKTVTEGDVRKILEDIKRGVIKEGGYIPLRISTPGIIQERLFTQNRPLVMPVSKIVQAMRDDKGPTKGKNTRGHSFTADDLIQIAVELDSPDYLYAQENGRGVAVIKHKTKDGNIAVIVEFDNNINPAYMNQFEGGTYNVAVTTFNIDGGMIGLFEYAAQNGWQEVFNKEKEGDPAKKFPATRPFAVEQDSLNEIVQENSKSVKKNSIRYQVNQAAREHLQEQSAGMAEDVAALNDLVAAQRRANRGRLKVEALDAAASHLMKTAGAKGDKMELVRLLDTYYRYIAQSNALTWEGLQDQAQPVVDWLMDHTVRSRQISEYARDILNDLRTSRIYLDDVQRGEVAHMYGSFGAYRNMMMGSITIANDRSVSLDSKWQELAELYPDVFDADTNAADMPVALLDAVQRLRTSDTSELEYEYNREFVEHDLRNRVYDSYWNASTLYAVADHYEKQIKELKGKHRQRMSGVYMRHQAAEQQLRSQFKQRQENIQSYYEEKAQRREAEYRESRRKTVESHNRTQMRRKIQRTVKSLRSLLEKAPKDRRVKEELQEFVSSALKTADLVFLENYNEYDMVRKGLGITLRGNEQQLVKECRNLLEQLDDARSDIEGREPPEISMHHKWDPDRALQKDAREEAIKKELSKKMAILRDAGVFEAEYKRLHDVDANQLIDELVRSYQKLKETESDYLKGAYREEVMSKLSQIREEIGAKAVRDMSQEELEQIYELYHMVHHVILTANDTFAGERAQSVAKLGGSVVQELKDRKRQKTSRGAVEDLKKIGWNGLTVPYAFRMIGSRTMQKLYENLRAGEDVWARDMQEAKDFWQKQTQKYGAFDWDMDQRQTFHDSKGMEFSVSLGQLMSLYALSKRQQALGHLEVGGFMLDTSERYIENIADKLLPKRSTSAETYKLDKRALEAICSKLTPQQRAFVDATQNYLSGPLAEKGNEVSMKLFGVKLFKERNYFPLRTASQGRYQSTELIDQNKLKNSGFTKEVKPKANNSVVLSDYSNVWTGHVNQMGLYHGMTLPMEDMDRVLNFGKTIRENDQGEDVETYEQDSVCSTLQNIFGEHPEAYIRDLMKQLNGGVRTDPVEQAPNKMFGKFKKAAVAASLSVWIQQWTSVFRSMAYIDPKYFMQKVTVGKARDTQVEEMKKYCPVAIIKEMGGFDTGVGSSVHDFITTKEPKGIKDFGKEFVKDPGKRMDEITGWLPARADENTWMHIWVAVKRETMDRHPDLRPGSREFYKVAAERFSEVITMTQVYDSVMAKSAMMRSKNFGAKMLTQFMAEPTIAANMAWDAALQHSRTGRVQARTAAALISSVVANSLCASLIYAMRDDDEEETFLEKYAQSVVSNLVDGLNPLTYIPIVRDIWSVLQGYDVGRSDMELWASLSSAMQKLVKAYNKEKPDTKEIASAWGNVVDTVFSLFGIPEKNIRREINAVINLFMTLQKDFNGRMTTAGSVADTAQAGFLADMPILGWIMGETKGEKLLDALIAGDTRYADRLRSTYKTTSASNNAITKVIQERYADGKISREVAVQYMTAYAGKSEEEAGEKITWWEFQAAYPDSELTEAAAVKWQTELKDKGISLQAYTDYRTRTADLTADKDKNGDPISGSKKKKVLAVIHSLPLTRAQKNTLYLDAGYSRDDLGDAPWN